MCDLFGVLLRNLPNYSIFIHVIAMCFGNQALQVYRIAKKNYFKSYPLQQAYAQPSEDEYLRNKRVDYSWDPMSRRSILKP